MKMARFVIVILVSFFSLASAESRLSDDAIKLLVKGLETQGRQIEALQDVVENQQKEIEQLKQALGQTYGDNDTPQTMSTWNNGTSTLSRSNRQLQMSPETVAFTAILSQKLSSLGVNQNIVFDAVDENIGGAYHAHHGLFIAPIPGVYVFHTTIFAQPQNIALCRLNVNGVDKAGVYLPVTSHYHGGSQMIVALLKTNDEVSVRVKSATSVIYSDGNSYVSFTGFLLKDTSELLPTVVG